MRKDFNLEEMEMQHMYCMEEIGEKVASKSFTRKEDVRYEVRRLLRAKVKPGSKVTVIFEEDGDFEICVLDIYYYKIVKSVLLESIQNPKNIGRIIKTLNDGDKSTIAYLLFTKNSRDCWESISDRNEDREKIRIRTYCSSRCYVYQKSGTGNYTGKLYDLEFKKTYEGYEAWFSSYYTKIRLPIYEGYKNYNPSDIDSVCRAAGRVLRRNFPKYRNLVD